MIGPVADGKIDWEPAVGTGGYQLVSHHRGISMDAQAQSRATGRPDRAHFDDVKFIGINDINARMNALITGEVDAIYRGRT